MNSKSIIVLISVAFSITTILSLPHVYADVVSVTVDLQTILLEPNQIIPLLDTKSVGNMSKLQISATLPCESNNTPKLKIFAGALGELVSVIDSSSDYKNLRGPFNTCYYEDTISPSSNLPVLNKVFLNNSGSSSVVTNLGSVVTLTANVGNVTSGGSQPSGFIVATGGTITTDGNFKVHTFNSSGTFQITSGSGAVEYLVVAGGGGGGGSESGKEGGGGGAGGYLNGTLNLSPGNYTITVGAGGASGSGVSVDGSNGGDSTFHTVTAAGGGGGGANSGATGNNGKSGGSGGGGGGAGALNNGGAAGLGTSGQGNNGGDAGDTGGSLGFGGGGGGAGGVGGTASGGSGIGGLGKSNDINGSVVTYASGASSGTGVAGAANTGNGGGGGTTSGSAGGAGGSGVVILRYQFQ